MALTSVGGGGVWVCAAAACLGACGPTRDGLAGGGSSSQGDAQESSSSSAADSSSGDAPSPDPVPLRLLTLGATLEGGQALSFVEFGSDGELEAKPLHPGLDPALVVDEFEILTGTDRVAFIARAADATSGSLYVARADAGGQGVAMRIEVGDDVREIAWLSAAQTLVVAAETTSHRVEITPTEVGVPVEIDGPAAPARLGPVDAAGLRIAADFAPLSGPPSCFVASLEPAAPTDWIDAYDGADARCRVVGFDPDAVVFGTGEDANPTLRRAVFGGGELQPAVQIASDATVFAVVGPHGVVYQSSDGAVVHVPTDGAAIGEPQQLGSAGVGFRRSADGRYLVFDEHGVNALVDLEHPDDGALLLTLPSTYYGAGQFVAVSPDGAFAFATAVDAGAEYWRDKTSLWRFDISSGAAEAPVQITETSATGGEVNPSSIEAIALAPDGSAIAYARLQPTPFGDDGDIRGAELGDGGVLADALIADAPTAHIEYSPDATMLAFGDDFAQVRGRDGGELIGVSAVRWRWWPGSQ